ncbi:CemA family protein [Synechocystis sp. LKSZ1]
MKAEFWEICIARQPMALVNWWQQLNQWTSQQALQALERAYQAALAIQALELAHFGGGKISPTTEIGQSTYQYFKISLDRELRRVRLNLLQFQGGKTWLANLSASSTVSTPEDEILQRLSTIEAIVGKYRTTEEDLGLEGVPMAPQTSTTEDSEHRSLLTPMTDEKTGQKTWGIRRPFDPNSEQEIVQQFRQLRQQRKIALRFLIVLVIVPVLVQTLSKNLIFSPIFNHLRIQSVKLEEIEFKQEIIQESIEEFVHFKEGLEIYELLKGEDSHLDKTERLREKAQEIILQAARRSQEGVKNIFADLTSLAAFVLLVIVFRRQFTIARQFLSRYFLGLSDVTKVFIFILLTDTFVGFHSAEGWEVILGTLMTHLGIPENRNFIFLFIATIPVILDSIFKLLIFNYFTRQSPSAVAILEKMQK